MKSNTMGCCMVDFQFFEDIYTKLTSSSLQEVEFYLGQTHGPHVSNVLSSQHIYLIQSIGLANLPAICFYFIKSFIYVSSVLFLLDYDVLILSISEFGWSKLVLGFLILLYIDVMPPWRMKTLINENLFECFFSSLLQLEAFPHL